MGEFFFGFMFVLVVSGPTVVTVLKCVVFITKHKYEQRMLYHIHLNRLKLTLHSHCVKQLTMKSQFIVRDFILLYCIS